MAEKCIHDVPQDGGDMIVCTDCKPVQSLYLTGNCLFLVGLEIAMGVMFCVDVRTELCVGGQQCTTPNIDFSNT